MVYIYIYIYIYIYTHTHTYIIYIYTHTYIREESIDSEGKWSSVHKWHTINIGGVSKCSQTSQSLVQVTCRSCTELQKQAFKMLYTVYGFCCI